MKPKQELKKAVPVLVLVLGLALFLSTGKELRAVEDTFGPCSCNGAGSGWWVHNHCYLWAGYEECDDSISRMVKKCKYNPGSPESSCDCGDEVLCPYDEA
jgi:hypothetical protein